MNGETGSFEVGAQMKPLVRWNRNVDAIAASAADNVEGAADALDGLVEDHVVFKRVGTNHVIVIRVPRAPDKAGGAILRPGDGLEHHFNEAVLDTGVVLEEQRKGRTSRLLYDV